METFHWGLLAFCAGWLLPVPYIVELNIQSIVEAKVPMNDREIKIAATILGFLWPIFFAVGFLKGIAKAMKGE